MTVQWTKRPVGEVLRLEYGKPLPTTDRKPDGLYPVYGANGEKDRTDEFYCDRPSIIVGRKGSAGEVNLTDERFWPLDVTYFVTFAERQHELRFLYYLLKTLNLPRLAKGVKPGINRNEVYSQLAPIPPLHDQRRIVGILDEAFEGIATAKANAEKNLQNARALFESSLQSVFASRAEGRVDHRKPLADLCELIVDCEHNTAPREETGVPSLRTPNIGKGRLLLDRVYRVSNETYREWTRRAEPLPGDLVLAREAPAGNVAVIPENLKVCLGQRTVLIRPKRNVFEPAFLAWLLLRDGMQQKLLAHSRGATVQHVNLKDIRALDVGPIPPLPEQYRIVAVVDELSRQCERLESVYQRKVDALDTLKQSLLHQAFTGQLRTDVA
jgi:type I restriction enzyme S subunit